MTRCLPLDEHPWKLPCAELLFFFEKIKCPRPEPLRWLRVCSVFFNISPQDEWSAIWMSDQLCYLITFSCSRVILGGLGPSTRSLCDASPAILGGLFSTEVGAVVLHFSPAPSL